MRAGYRPRNRDPLRKVEVPVRRHATCKRLGRSKEKEPQPPGRKRGVGMIQQKQEVTYPYAIAVGGRITGIAEANRGTEFLCPGCRQNMSPVQGESLRWHYRHHQNTDPCSKDSALHITSQLLIEREFKRALRERRKYTVSHPCSICRLPMGFLNIALPKARMVLENGEMVRGARPDVTVKRNRFQVIIEVVVTHDLEDKTKRAYLKSKIPVYILRMHDFTELEKIEGGVATDEALNTERTCEECLNRREDRMERVRVERKEASKKRAEQRTRERPLRRAAANALKKLERVKSGRLLFKPWHEAPPNQWGNTKEMYPETRRAVFSNAIGLTEMGFRQEDPEKPWLFRIEMSKDLTVYADLGGTPARPVHKDTGAEIHVAGTDEEFKEVRDDLLERVKEKLVQEGIGVRTEGLRDDERQHRPEPRLLAGEPGR